VQEVVRIILEAVYDSPHGPYFSEHSYGFRRGKSVHGALKEVQKKWSGVIWLVEGDIQSCFDDIDHHTLVDVLRKKIKDERFIALIWKFLKAGYQDLERARHDSLAGTPQGGIASPILANIYLRELDAFVEQLQAELEKGRQRRPNHEYELVSDRRYRLAKAGKADTEEFRRLGTQMRNLPSLDTRDPNFVRMKYVRYRIRKGRARDSQKVTASTNGSGRQFKRRSTGMEVVLKAPMDRLIKRLASKGFCDEQERTGEKRRVFQKHGLDGQTGCLQRQP
jgi:retron-type reverse transcriptase